MTVAEQTETDDLEPLLMDVMNHCAWLIIRIRALEVGSLTHPAVDDVSGHLFAAARAARDIDVDFFSGPMCVGRTVH